MSPSHRSSGCLDDIGYLIIGAIILIVGIGWILKLAG